MRNNNDGYSQVAQDQSDLGTNLVGPAPGEMLERASSTPLMEVVAPATLPEGYRFDASFGEQTVQVVVPVGGVERGQKFTVPLPQQFDAMITGVTIPVGHWRDSLFDIFAHGGCHPHCWTSCCCCIVASGQIISRLRLKWNARPGSIAETSGSFQVISMIAFIYWAVFLSLYLYLFMFDPNTRTPDGAPWIQPPRLWMVFASVFEIWLYGSFVFLALFLCRLRNYVRERYAIPADDTEDCCCSLCCPCLVVGQMLRHTTDYNVYPASCCTPTGIPSHAPSIV